MGLCLGLRMGLLHPMSLESQVITGVCIGIDVRDLADSLGTLLDILGEQRETLGGLQAALDSLAVQRAHEATRLLTTLALVLLPMILIAAIFGMNLALPFERNPLAFPIAVLIMLAVSAGLVAFARYRRWI